MIGGVAMDEYLQEFLQDIPSSRRKLLAAWDGLSAETQIKILWALSPKLRLHPDVTSKALQSRNEYIRYLAVRRGSLNAVDIFEGLKELYKRAATDPSSLVKNAPNEGMWGGTSLGEAKEFSEMPFDLQLAVCQSGQLTPKLLSEWLKSVSVISNYDQKNAYDIVCEYMSLPHIREYRRSYDDPEYFWNLLPIVNEDIANVLISYASPPTHPDIRWDSEWVQWLWKHPKQFEKMLNRDDIGLAPLRKMILLHPDLDTKYSGYALRLAAGSRNCPIDDSDVGELFLHRPELLQFVAQSREATFAQLEAIKNYFESDGTGELSRYWEWPNEAPSRAAARNFAERLARRVEECKTKEGRGNWPEGIYAELFFLGLYRISKAVRRWNAEDYNWKTFPNELRKSSFYGYFVGPALEARNTWEIYLALKSAYDKFNQEYINTRFSIGEEIARLEKGGETAFSMVWKYFPIEDEIARFDFLVEERRVLEEAEKNSKLSHLNVGLSRALAVPMVALPVVLIAKVLTWIVSPLWSPLFGESGWSWPTWSVTGTFSWIGPFVSWIGQDWLHLALFISGPGFVGIAFELGRTWIRNSKFRKANKALLDFRYRRPS